MIDSYSLQNYTHSRKCLGWFNLHHHDNWARYLIPTGNYCGKRGKNGGGGGQYHFAKSLNLAKWSCFFSRAPGGNFCNFPWRNMYTRQIIFIGEIGSVKAWKEALSRPYSSNTYGCRQSQPLGPLMGALQCRLSILWNGNIPCHYLLDFPVVF